MNIKNVIKLEELGMFILGAFGFIHFGGTWYIFILSLLLPDVGMLGYLISTSIGAYSYNILHHKGLSIFLFLIGTIFKMDVIIFIGIIMFSHSSMDRAFGYGLKYKNNFKSTHLGWLAGEKI